MNKTLYIITGATGGIGRAIYHRLVAEQPDSQYILAVRRSMDVEKHTKVVLLDFAEAIDITNLKKCVQEQIDHVAEVCLIISSGFIHPISPIGTHTSIDIEGNIRVNATSPTICIEMLKKVTEEYEKSFQVIHLDSGAAYRPIHGWSLYCSTKAYMSMYLRVLATESNCRVVNFDPGVVDTNMQQVIRSSTKEDFPMVDSFISYKEEGGLATPDEVADQIYTRYLAEWTATQLEEGMR